MAQMIAQMTSIKLDERSLQGLSTCGIPAHMQEGIIEYFNNYRPTGDFLRHILSNDFVSAAGHADPLNKQSLYNYCHWLYMYAPARAHNIWGSEEVYKNWLEIGEKKRNKSRHIQDCDQCKAIMIQGVYCHEQGCINQKENGNVRGNSKG